MDDRQDIEKDALEAIRINRRKKGGETGYIKGNASKSRRILDGPSPFGRKRGDRDRGKAHESLLWTLHFYYSTVINIKLFPTILAWVERHRVTKKRQCVTERAWFSGGKYALMKIRSSGGRRHSIVLYLEKYHRYVYIIPCINILCFDLTNISISLIVLTKISRVKILGARNFKKD